MQHEVVLKSLNFDVLTPPPFDPIPQGQWGEGGLQQNFVIHFNMICYKGGGSLRAWDGTLYISREHR